jgi:Membrane-bound toxin component of toxin-antitoxin system
MKFTLHWSLWELGFVTACHLAAALSIIYSELLFGLMLVIILAVAGSYLCYLRERISTYLKIQQRQFKSRDVPLILAEQGATLGYRGRLWEARPPTVSYFSEFLLVLRFPQAVAVQGEVAAVESIDLVVWPDSLSGVAQKRLRRYLRFDLPASLSAR